jgi:tetratricopeptide (TPR) repeat protein
MSGDREALEAERDFLLRSLDDLEAERAAGDIDESDYQILHDDYTARAAAAIDTLAGSMREPPAAPSQPKLVKIVMYGGIAAFAILASVLLAGAIGQRRPGDTITGNSRSGTTAPATDEVTSAKQAVDAAPDNYGARLRYARALAAAGNYPDAIVQYVEASTIDPEQAVPLAESGWLSSLIARQVDDESARETLLTAAHRRFDQAIAIEPEYSDSYVWSGLTYVYEEKWCEAVPRLQRFLALAPSDHPLRQNVLDTLADAVDKCPTARTEP